MNIQKRFERAAKRVWRLNKRPDDDTLLLLYALYKQATDGDASPRRPLRGGLAGMAKWRAWKKQLGLSKNDAMIRYCEMVDNLAVA